MGMHHLVLHKSGTAAESSRERILQLDCRRGSATTPYTQVCTSDTIRGFINGWMRKYGSHYTWERHIRDPGISNEQATYHAAEEVLCWGYFQRKNYLPLVEENRHNIIVSTMPPKRNMGGLQPNPELQKDYLDTQPTSSCGDFSGMAMESHPRSNRTAE
ncbi:hypothetical protein R1flu_002087 [Riccia fluitans]|uniref:Uncharacterized protein n=1 Tax=Riccia fluitans TaxID=41844 RepID=A0ABD1Y542_9MARC